MKGNKTGIDRPKREKLGKTYGFASFTYVPPSFPTMRERSLLMSTSRFFRSRFCTAVAASGPSSDQSMAREKTARASRQMGWTEVWARWRGEGRPTKEEGIFWLVVYMQSE